MEFTKDSGSASNRIQAYDKDYVLISGTKYYCNVLIMPETLIAPWGPEHYQSLTEEDLNALLKFHPQLVLIGTGVHAEFIPEILLSGLKNEGIGVEVMSFPAACRTYTLLQAEGRNVLALLFIN